MLAVAAGAVPPLASVADPAAYPLPDLAVLDLHGAEGWGHPCAGLMSGQPVLDGTPAGLYLAGYTIEHGKGPALTGATTEFESEVREDPYTVYKLKRGLLLPGFSGSPLLDVRAGTVAGVVESTRGRHADLGGFAVPAGVLAVAFPDLVAANEAFHQGDERWAAAVEAERTRAAERAGMRARLGLRPAVVKLATGEEVSAATLLRPRHAVVGYVGREQLLSDLAAWCEQDPVDGENTELWLVTGGGGFVLLVRRRATRADLLGMFNLQREEHLGSLLRRAPLSRLDDAASEVDRLELFRRAVADFRARSGAVPDGVRLPLLRTVHFARPLYVLTAAYLSLAPAGADVDALSEPDLLRALLDEHEAGHWDRWAQRRQFSLDPADQRTAVAVATLLTAVGEAEALTLARVIPHQGLEPETRLIAIARWLAQLYPAARKQDQIIVAPLEPDRLGEVLVGDVLRQYPDLLAAAIDVASDRQLSQALTVTGRIARDDPAVRDQLQAALDQRLGDLFQRGFGGSDDTLLDAVITAMTISRPAQGALAAADRFPATLPVWFRPVAVTVTSMAVDGLRARASHDPAIEPELARGLSELATRLSDVGRRDEALEVAGEAVTIRRQLAEASPDTLLPDLPSALGNMATFLSEVGRQEEALEVAGEADRFRIWNPAP